MDLNPRFTHSKQAISGVVICGLMLVFLPGCGIPQLRRPESGPVLPETFNGEVSTENSSQLSIEDFYQDPILTQLIDQGLANNRELKILNEEVQIAGNEILSRSGAYLPFVTAGGAAGLERVSRFNLFGSGLYNDYFLPGKRFPNPFGNYMGGLDLYWKLDIYRQLRNARDAAAERYVAASEKRNYFVTELVAEIAQNYYKLIAFDKRLENLDQIITLQEQSQKVAEAKKEAARGTELAVQRFKAEVRKNQSDKLIVNQEIIVTENRINFLLNRYPQTVERNSSEFLDLQINALSLGLPSQLLQYRPDIREAERDLTAAGLDVKVARVNFFPQLVINGATGLNAFSFRYLFEPQAVVGSIAAGMVGPLINKRAIQADYLNANARQLQAVYNYQRVILEAFTEVINRVAKLQNYSQSIDVKKQQVVALVASVESASNLFQAARPEVDYMDVLFSQRDLLDARRVLIETKLEQLTAIVDTYQALGGGVLSNPNQGPPTQNLSIHTVREGENLQSISVLYYNTPSYAQAIWAANNKVIRDPNVLVVGEKIVIPHIEQLAPAQTDQTTQPVSSLPESVPTEPAVAPPPASVELGPFSQKPAVDTDVKKASETKPWWRGRMPR